MRPESIAAFFLILAVIALLLSAAFTQFWDSLVHPFVSVFGATVQVIGLPVIASGLVLAFFLILRNFRMR